ncbi:MAG: hypothetical protein EXR72_19775 [Myxococcales bacterium]|nr:hypothetical protein [Myxococcales bacterium]
MLGRAHGYLLPCEAVLLQKRKGGSIADAVRGITHDTRWKSYGSIFVPVPHPEHFPAPSEEEGARRIARRFGPLFDRGWG